MKHARLNVYLAGPLFSDAEKTFNLLLTSRLECFVDVYLPQRDGCLMVEMLDRGVSVDLASKHVFNRDVSAIKNCDFIVAVLDGRAIDEGVAFEIGVAYSNGKPCIGLQTDPRRLAAWGNNPMIQGALSTSYNDLEDLMAWVKTEADDFVNSWLATA